MPLDDFLDPAQESRRIKKAQQRAAVHQGGVAGDTQHPGAGYESIQIGVNAQAAPITDTTADEAIAIGSGTTADGFGAAAFGARAYAQYENALALGWLAFAGHAFATAIGHQSVTTATHQIMLGRSEDTVRVPGNLTVIGTFSNPSARHLKTNIESAPCLRDVFPPSYEYEYLTRIGERRLGHMADELRGTDAERFVTVDENGTDAIDYVGLHGAQIYALRAELTEARTEIDEMKARLAALENIVKGLTNG